MVELASIDVQIAIEAFSRGLVFNANDREEESQDGEKSEKKRPLRNSEICWKQR